VFLESTDTLGANRPAGPSSLLSRPTVPYVPFEQNSAGINHSVAAGADSRSLFSHMAFRGAEAVLNAIFKRSRAPTRGTLMPTKRTSGNVMV
jgi:hypothetical protein